MLSVLPGSAFLVEYMNVECVNFITVVFRVAGSPFPTVYGGLKIECMLLRQQSGVTKVSCFICEWDSREKLNTRVGRTSCQG